MRGLDASRVDENLQKWGDSFGLLDRPMVQIWELDAAGVRQHALQRLVLAGYSFIRRGRSGAAATPRSRVASDWANA
jgi:hypothetical protein